MEVIGGSLCNVPIVQIFIPTNFIDTITKGESSNRWNKTPHKFGDGEILDVECERGEERE